MKHILFLTWKDIKHPRSGGAERVILEHAKRLVQDSHRVTWISSGYEWWEKEEVIDWINIIRIYSINTIYFFAWSWYKKFIQKNPVDIIIDEAWGIPLLSALYEKKIPIYFFIHHIGDHEYDIAFPFPFNKFFKKFVFWTFSLYKKFPTVTVSNSTAEELKERFGFENVSIVENATHLKPIDKINWKSKKKEIVFYGRLTPMKRADHAIRAFAILAKQDSEYQMNIVGNPQDKEYAEKLRNVTKELRLEERVHFLGFSHEIVEEYLPRAEVLLVPSTKEWYGLIVLEWNCFWLPVLAYDVAGLRDSVRKEKNGLLIEDWDYTAMWKKLIDLTSDKKKLKNLSESSLNFIKVFGGWDERFQEFKNIILK